MIQDVSCATTVFNNFLAQLDELCPSTLRPFSKRDFETLRSAKNHAKTRLCDVAKIFQDPGF